MRKKMFRIFIVLSAALSMSMPGSTLAADSTVTVKVTIQQATLAVSNATVDFGTIVSAGADTVVIDASAGGAVSVPGDTAVTNITSAGSSGTINVTSTGYNAIVGISYPASIVVAEGGGDTMTVDQISTYSTPSPLTLDGSGSGTINVGGRLSIGATQTAGNYSQTGTVSVNFQ